MRTLVADGKKVETLRAKKGWSQEKLAEEATLSRGAIQRVERGVAVLLDTLRRVATALEVKVTDLLADTSPHSDADIDTGGSVAVATTTTEALNIIIPADFEEWTSERTAQYMRLIADLAKTQGTIKVTGVKKGSVILTVELTTDDAERIMRAWDKGEFDQLQIASIVPLSALARHLAMHEQIERNPSQIPDVIDEQTRQRITKAIGCLGDQDPDTRRRAARKIGEIGLAAVSAIPPLLATLRDQDSRVRRAAREALIELGHPSGTAWSSVTETKYQIGQAARGLISHIADVGVYVSFEPWVEGLIGADTLTLAGVDIASLKVGDHIDVLIRAIDIPGGLMQLALPRRRIS